MISDFNNYILMENIRKFDNKAGIVIQYNNKILLVCQANSYDKRLGIPKGKIKDGEDELDAAIRELKEEVGITILPSQLNPSPKNVILYNKSNEISGTLTYYTAKIKKLSEIGLRSGPIRRGLLNKSEISWAGFITLSEAYHKIRRSQLIILDNL
jgi:8-oxo-dGTP pyrophosphatase MutT (NUDIX family)